VARAEPNPAPRRLAARSFASDRAEQYTSQEAEAIT
jgi:hypothetical protein